MCGANGAGKSTFAKLLAGVETPTEGEIQIDGLPAPGAQRRRGRAGRRADDVPGAADHRRLHRRRERVALQAARGPGHPALGAPRSTRTARDPRGAGQGRPRAACGPSQLARDLGPGQRQMLSLSRAEVTTHKIMILDETTASTSEEHFNDILDLVKREREAGTHIMFVSHRLNEVFAMCGPDRGAAQRQARRRAQDLRDQPGRDHHADDRPGPQGARPAEAGATTEGKQPLVVGARPARRHGGRGVLRRLPRRGRRPLRAGRQRPVVGGPHRSPARSRRPAARSRSAARRSS